jgi:hypothetical protein
MDDRDTLLSLKADVFSLKHLIHMLYVWQFRQMADPIGRFLWFADDARKNLSERTIPTLSAAGAGDLAQAIAKAMDEALLEIERHLEKLPKGDMPN